MKNILTIAILSAALFAPMASHAAKGKKGKKGDRGSAQAVSQYDSNKNGMIDGSEIEAVRKAFDADKTGPLKGLDTNADGSLSDTEISAGKGKAKRKKKN